MASTVPTPIDVRLMNLTASVLFVCFGVLVVGGCLWALLRNPAFVIGGITVQGEMTHNTAATLQNHVGPKLQGNLFTIDLNATRDAFEAVPWVRRALVRRDFPNRLRVTLEEHHPVAYWGTEAESKLIDSFGEVFEANVADVEDEALPRLQGPEGQAGEVLAMYHALAQGFKPIGMDMTRLSQSGRGSWLAELDNGAEVELGRGNAEELAARLKRFTGTVAQVAEKYGRRADALESADLRHGDGYALRLKGVTTVGVDNKPKGRK